MKPFLDEGLDDMASWSILRLFGYREFDVMTAAIEHGGHCRVGFENNMYLKDRSLAPIPLHWLINWQQPVARQAVLKRLTFSGFRSSGRNHRRPHLEKPSAAIQPPRCPKFYWRAGANQVAIPKRWLIR